MTRVIAGLARRVLGRGIMEFEIPFYETGKFRDYNVWIKSESFDKCPHWQDVAEKIYIKVLRDRRIDIPEELVNKYTREMYLEVVASRID